MKMKCKLHFFSITILLVSWFSVRDVRAQCMDFSAFTPAFSHIYYISRVEK